MNRRSNRLLATAEDALPRGHLTALVVVVAAGVFARVLALDRLPGVHGDEAWYGVNAHLLLDGEPIFLRTGIGNVLSPLHSGLLVGLEAFLGPSFALLRVPSALWGCLALLLAYPMLAPLMGVRAAMTSTAMLALSPAAVSQARLGWDPSATVLLSLFVVVFAIRNHAWLCGVSFLLTLIAHPTNIFLAPIVASQWGPAAVEWYRSAPERHRRRISWTAAIVLPFAAVGGFFVARALAHAGFAPSIEMAIERATFPSAWQALAVGVLNLFSGITTAAAIAGPPPIGLRLGASAIVLSAFVLAGIGCWTAMRPRTRILYPLWTRIAVLGVRRAPKRQRNQPRVPRTGYQAQALGWLARREGSTPQVPWLLGGIIVSVFTFHVVAGPRALEPGVERYAMFLVIPLTIVCGLGLSLLVRGAHLAAAAVCCTLAAALAFGYFVPLATRGGDGHSTYRTGPVEPKRAAFEFLSIHSRDAGVVAVFADDWWLYWPLRYLAWHDRRIHVEMLGDYDRWLNPPGATARPYPRPPDRAYAVVFHQGAWARLINEAVLFTAIDPIGRPILDVMTVPPDAYGRLRDVMPWQSHH